MFLQQTFISLGRALPAVIAPAIIGDLKYSAAWVGIYFTLSASASLVSQLGCGGFIVRYGAMRMSQLSLVMVAVGNALAVFGTPLMLALSAIVAGAGGAVSTPASSHLLGRCAQPKYLPLVFSIKQTAVPAGMLIGGMLGPLLVVSMGWRGAMLVSAAASAIFAVMLQPLRARFDDDRVPTRELRLSDFGTTYAAVTGSRDLRNLSLACLAFNGTQAVVTAYFVVFLTTIGYSLVAAGFLFSVAVAVAVPGRILWGWLGSGHVKPRVIMAGLAFGMAASVATFGLCGAGWPAVLVGLVASVLSLTALSWHGILLAEAAREAPHMRGAVTGGVLSFGQVGALGGPLVYSALLGITGSYGLGFVVCALPALLVGMRLIRRGPRGKH